MRLSSLVILVAACGGSAARGPTGPRLVPQVGDLQWYRVLSTCAQGPFEVDVPVTGTKWGEEIELRLATPRKVALHAVVLVDGVERAKTNTVIGPSGQTGGRPDNARCLADARERMMLGRPGGGGGGTPGTPGTLVVPPVPDGPAPEAPGIPLQPAPEPSYVTPSTVIHVRLDVPPPPGARVRIRFWSIEPNDLNGVLFGAVRIAWRPSIPEAEYEAYLVDQQRQRAERDRAQAERDRIAAERMRLQMEQENRNYRPDPERDRRAREEAELRARRERERAERDRLAAEEAARRRAIEVTLRLERERRRKAFCDAHHDDRDCWGAGGYRVHAELMSRADERARYCVANPNDARCWTQEQWAAVRTEVNERIAHAKTPPKPPDGPPPAALADPQPPRPSENADWRSGYWHWLDGNWVWLAGQWRVPDSDIEQERTAHAPSAPPPLRVETVVVAPAPAAVWVAGFWMWNGTSWVWIPGSWQLRPNAGVRWRAPEWRVRGSVHILVPGGWIRGAR